MIFRLGKSLKYMEHWHPIFVIFPRYVGIKNGHYTYAWLQWVERKQVNQLWTHRLINERED